MYLCFGLGYLFYHCDYSEQNLSKMRDIANHRLVEWKKKFMERIHEVERQVLEFKTKERMSEADIYLAEVQEIVRKLEEFNSEVNNNIFYDKLNIQLYIIKNL